MLRQRTTVSWRHGRDNPIITTVYVDRGPASATRRRTDPEPDPFADYDGETTLIEHLSSIAG